jgi:hypothetical protein
MKNLLRVAAVGLVALAAVAMLPSAEASCPNARTIGPNAVTITTPPGSFGGPYGPYSVSPELKGVFWSFGTAPGGGNPSDGLGNDSGSTPQENWIYIGGYGSPATLDGGLGYSHWNAPGIDGCVDGDGTLPTADAAQCTVILLSDDDDAGQGYFALASVGPDAGQNYNFLTATGGGGITLAPTPKPNITGSTRNGGLSVQLTLNVTPGAGPAAGYYLACQSAGLTSGSRYRIYTQSTPRDAGAPSGENSRDLSNWTLDPSTAGGIPVGSPTNVTVTCGGTDLDFYLCSTLLIPTGNGSFYELANCSRDATKVECGPNLAEPGRPARPRPSTGRLPSTGRR